MPRRRRTVSAAAAAAAALAVACGDGAVEVERAPDAGPGEAPGEDMPDTGAPDQRPRATVELHGEEEVAVTWRVAMVFGDATPLLRDAAAGTLSCPRRGRDEAHGVEWFEVTPEPDACGESDGRIGRYAGVNELWAVACVTVKEGEGLFVRPGRFGQVYSRGILQPGDFYGHGRTRVPVRAEAGENVVALRAVQPRPDYLEAKVFKTPGEVHLNLQDTTPPWTDLPRKECEPRRRELRLPASGDAAEQWLGAPLLRFAAEPAIDLTLTVLESEHWQETTVTHAALPGGAATQVGFLLRPKAPHGDPGETVPARLRIDSPSLHSAYQTTVDLTVVDPEEMRFRTFLDPTDDSVQHYTVRQPAEFDPARDYGLILALHGAGVEGTGIAGQYRTPKDWAFIVAPTNRRGFGFDWEEWGHENGLRALDHATASYRIDPTRVYVTGHSMGGHGTWHFIVMNPGRFATAGPSAGWGSFYSYTGFPRPETAAFARARAHSDTHAYIANIARRGVYVVHGGADTVVPPREGREMRDLALMVTPDVQYYEHPGGGHCWESDDIEEDNDCVDWPPLLRFMRERSFDPYELEFAFTTPMPSYSPTHSYLTIESALSPWRDVTVSSERVRDTVRVTTDNARSLRIDGAALRARGVRTAVVDGRSHHVPDGELWIGARGGKRAERYGPFNQVFRRRFCYLYPDGDADYAEIAAFLATDWTIYGNGRSCALPLSALTAQIRAEHNLIYLGLPPEQAGDPDVPITWDEEAITVDGVEYRDAALVMVFPEGDRLSAVMTATEGDEARLYGLVPFSSRGSNWPDWFVWGASAAATGFFDAEWREIETN